MKSVLISIQPKWCELIASGKKTVEVRKTRPKIKTPFKCYIYCTQTKTIGDFILCKSKENVELFGLNAVKGINKGFAQAEDIQLKGKVIGEFVCDNIEQIGFSCYRYHGEYICREQSYIEQSCLSYGEMYYYLGEEYGFGWHISDLVIYEQPKELRELKKINRECWYADLGLAKRDCPECQNESCFIRRPPQSWCYVKGINDFLNEEKKI